MAHQRKLIRQEVQARLWGKTVAEDRVFATRVVPLKGQEVPAISVYALDEESDDEESAPRELRRDLDLAIEAWVKHSKSAPADDAMDDICEQIENLMHADPYLKTAAHGELAADMVLASTRLEVIEVGDRLLGIAVLVYAVTYRTLAPEAPELLDEFLTAAAKHRIPGTTDDNDVEDLIDVREGVP